MYAGKYYSKNSYKSGSTSLISVTTINNGVMNFTDLNPIFEKGCLTMGKVEGVTFFQPDPFCATSDVTVLRAKSDLNPFLGMFLITIMNLDNYRWNYGRQIRLNDSQKLKIKLPVTTAGEPDWRFMEDYIKSLPYSSNLEKTND